MADEITAPVTGDKDGMHGEAGKPYTAPATQADLDRIIADRLTRERARYADYSDLKSAKAELDKLKAEGATETEKATAKARAEGAAEVLTKANARLVSAEARALAAEAKFRNPQLVARALDLTGITVADDGTVDAGAIKTRLKELSDADPYLVDDGTGGKPKPDPSQGGKGGGVSGRDLGLAEAQKRFPQIKQAAATS